MKTTPEEAVKLLDQIVELKKLSTPTEVVFLLQISIATYYAWRKNGMPKGKARRLQEKLLVDVVRAPRVDMVPEESRVWLCVTCWGCQARLEISCNSERHGLTYSPHVYLNSGKYVCSNCEKKLTRPT